MKQKLIVVRRFVTYEKQLYLLCLLWPTRASVNISRAVANILCPAIAIFVFGRVSGSDSNLLSSIIAELSRLKQKETSNLGCVKAA